MWSRQSRKAIDLVPGDILLDGYVVESNRKITADTIAQVTFDNGETHNYWADTRIDVIGNHRLQPANIYARHEHRSA